MLSCYSACEALYHKTRVLIPLPNLFTSYIEYLRGPAVTGSLAFASAGRTRVPPFV